MGNFLFTLAIVLLVLWVIGFLGYGIGGLIHALLVIAIISFYSGKQIQKLTNYTLISWNQTK